MCVYVCVCIVNFSGCHRFTEGDGLIYGISFMKISKIYKIYKIFQTMMPLQPLFLLFIPPIFHKVLRAHYEWMDAS